MAAKTGIIKTTTVKAYITKAKKMRTQAAAVSKLIADFDAVLEAVIVEAVALAKAAKRNTVMKVDVAAAVEKYLKKTDLTWDQTAAQVIKHNPTDLGKISKTILEWISAHEAQGKSLPVGTQAIGVFVRNQLEEMFRNNEVPSAEIQRMLTLEYSRRIFNLQFPLLRKAALPFPDEDTRLRYWVGAVTTHGEAYFICSQWFENRVNNDRPYFERWLQRMGRG